MVPRGSSLREPRLTTCGRSPLAFRVDIAVCERSLDASSLATSPSNRFPRSTEARYKSSPTTVTAGERGRSRSRAAGARDRGRAARARGGRAPFDLRRGRWCGRRRAKLGPASIAAAADDAPHRLRRLVDGDLLPRARQLYGAYRWAADRRCPSCRSSTRTSPCGSASWLTGDVLRNAARLLARAISPTLPALELPTDRPRPAVPDASRVPITLVLAPPPAHRSLHALASARGRACSWSCSPAFAAVLEPLHRQDDVVVGTLHRRPQPGRDRAPDRLLHQHAGPARTDLSGDPLPRAPGTRARVRSAAYRPPGDAVPQAGRGAPARTRPQPQPALPGGVPPVQRSDAAAATSSSAAAGSDGHRERGGDLRSRGQPMEGPTDCAEVEYNTDLFDAGTVERLIGHFRRLLEQAVEGPDGRISAITWCPIAERDATLAMGRGPIVPLDEAVTLVDLFESRVPSAGTPSRSARSTETAHIPGSRTRAHRLAARAGPIGLAARRSWASTSSRHSTSRSR